MVYHRSSTSENADSIFLYCAKCGVYEGRRESALLGRMDDIIAFHSGERGNYDSQCKPAKKRGGHSAAGTERRTVAAEG